MAPPSAASRVTIVTVSYNSLHVLPRMLDSVPEGASVVIVDNASDAPEPLAELCRTHGARLIRNSRNLGFGVACNLGAAGAQTEFLLFLNPDAALMPDALDQLVAAADRYPKASAMNPRIADDDGPFFK
ncbi:MAG: glycosyltransferase, partial [Albidovulum sp.]